MKRAERVGEGAAACLARLDWTCLHPRGSRTAGQAFGSSLRKRSATAVMAATPYGRARSSRANRGEWMGLAVSHDGSRTPSTNMHPGTRSRIHAQSSAPIVGPSEMGGVQAS